MRLRELKRQIDNKSPYYKKVGVRTVICKRCGCAFQFPSLNKKYCDKCKKEIKKEQNLRQKERYAQGKKGEKRAKPKSKKIIDEKVFTDGVKRVRWVKS